jgi:hypothetical protein
VVRDCRRSTLTRKTLSDSDYVVGFGCLGSAMAVSEFMRRSKKKACVEGQNGCLQDCFRAVSRFEFDLL